MIKLLALTGAIIAMAGGAMADEFGIPGKAQTEFKIPSATMGTHAASQARKRVSQGRELKSDFIDPLDILFNLRKKLPRCGVTVDGVHEYELAPKTSAGRGIMTPPEGFLKATVYYNIKDTPGKTCPVAAGRIKTLDLVRLTDGVWYAPVWRQSLVKRQ